ncbi:MAG: hypothetical protein J1E56_04170 [Ruminococcus sp.]|nr:hypothetical protein [Ruminococcus sp.]
MKKILLILLTAFLAVSCGCSQKEVTEIDYSDTYVENQDFQYNFCDKDTSRFIIQKCDDGYYFKFDSFLYFVDEKNMSVNPLCNKSDCLHDKETTVIKQTECTAYLSESILNSDFFYYNDHIYSFNDESYVEEESNEWIILNSIYKTDADGTNKEKVFTIDKEIKTWFIHRNIIYYTCAENNLVIGYDLSSNKAETVLDLDSFGLFNTTLDNMLAYGNNLYFGISGFESEEEFNKMVAGEDISPYEFYYVLNIIDNTSYEISSSLSGSIIVFEGFENDCFLYSEADYDNKNSPKTLYSVKNKAVKTQLDFKYENLFERYYSDNRFIYVKKAETIDDLENNIFEVYDKNNKQVAKIDFPDGFANNFYLGDNNYLFYFEGTNKGERLYYLSKENLAKGDTNLNLLFESKNT